MSKLGDKLNYGSMKSEAAASREITQIIPVRSGDDFVENQTIEWELPSNRPQEFLDMVNNVKLKLPIRFSTIAGVVANGGDVILDRGGVYGFVRSFQLTQNGVVISDLPKTNLLITTLSDFQMSAEYKSTTGRLMEGLEGDVLRGAIIPIGAAGPTSVVRTFYLSLLSTNLAMTTPHRDLFMGSSAPIIVRLTLESHEVAYKSVNGATTYRVERPEMHIKTTYLEQPAMDELNRSVKGKYQMLCNSYDHMSASLPPLATNAHIKLSFAKASLERIMFVIRDNETFNVATAGPKYSLGGRDTGGVLTYQLSINGQQYPQVPIGATRDADPEGVNYMYHLLAADNIASNYGQGTSGLMNSFSIGGMNGTTGLSGSGPQIVKANPYVIANSAQDNAGSGVTSLIPAVIGTALIPTGLSASNVGTFVGAINLEGGLITSGNSPLYSGINSLNGVDLYIDMTFAASNANPCTIDFFALSTEMVYLDDQTNLWSKRS